MRGRNSGGRIRAAYLGIEFPPARLIPSHAVESFHILFIFVSHSHKNEGVAKPQNGYFTRAA
jgi:hypothetical protein